jgi:hypothetical protein
LELSVEYLLLIEEKIKATADERATISRELSAYSTRHGKRYSSRAHELEAELKILWRRYKLISAIID